MWPVHFCDATGKDAHERAYRNTHSFSDFRRLLIGLAILSHFPPEKNPAQTGSVSPVLSRVISLRAANRLRLVRDLQNTRFSPHFLAARNCVSVISIVPLGCNLWNLGG